MPSEKLRGHRPERHPQGVHRARELHLPARADDAADDRPVRLLRREHPEVEHGLDLRLPLPREGLLGRPGGRVHARPPASPTCRRRSTRAWRSTTSRRAWRSSSTATTTSSRRSRSSARPGGCGRTSCATASAPRTRSRMMLRFHTQTGGVTLTAQQPENNIVRVALQGFAAVCGGTQSLHTNGFDEALALPTERAAKIALRTQQIIAHESGATDTVDPFAGSYFVEALTDEIEQRAQELIDKVDELGGSVNAIEFITGEIDESAWGYQERYRLEQDIVVGVNKYEEDDDRGPGHPARRPRVRARAGRAPEGVQGRPRPGRSSSQRLEELREAAARHRQPAAAHQGRAARPRLDGRGLRRDARRLRRVPADVLMTRPPPAARARRCSSSTCRTASSPRRTSATRSSPTSPRSSTARAARTCRWSGSSTPTRVSHHGSEEWQIVARARAGRRRAARPEALRRRLRGHRPRGRAGRARRRPARGHRRQTDACIRSTLHGALVRGYDATLVADAHTTEDQTRWGAPPPEQVIAHTNLYWAYHAAPGRTAGTSRRDVGF